MKSKTVVIGLSGGVDSSVAAILLKKQGYKVLGVTLKLWQKSGKFEDLSYINEAKNIAKKIGVEHIVIDAQEKFKQTVVKYFINEYLNGRTPSPCTLCNNKIKWKLLFDASKKYGYNSIATGHYINIKQINGFNYIEKGIDEIKDQSYFLWELSNKILKQSLTPLGNLTKTEVKNLAVKYKLNDIFNKKESMSVCFLQNTDYRTFITENIDNKEKIKEGKVFNINGEKIGTHKGIAFYTIGQKNGLNIKKQGAFYVKEIDAKNNSLIVSTKQELNKREIRVNNLSFINIDDLKTYNGKITVKVRGYGLNPEKKCNVEFEENDTLKIIFNDDAWAPAPGQPVVFYFENLLLGGGITL